MTQTKRAGRKRKKEADKVKVVSVYLTAREQKVINEKYGNATHAIRTEVLTKCG